MVEIKVEVLKGYDGNTNGYVFQTEAGSFHANGRQQLEALFRKVMDAEGYTT